MRLFRYLGLVSLLAVGLGLAVAQEKSAPQPQQPAQSSEPAATQQSSEPGLREQLAEQSEEAAGEHEEFKHSSSVKFVSRITGLSLNATYWLLVVLNFLIIAVLIGWALKKNLPGMFRARTETIRKSMDEARRASEGANRRLTEIEQRLSRLDAEIEEMKKAAEADAVAEEQRIRAAAEDDRRKIIEGAEQEIEAAAKAARRDLKAYIAELAVSLAEKKIKVDPKTDEALVHTFVSQLGKDGR